MPRHFSTHGHRLDWRGAGVVRRGVGEGRADSMGWYGAVRYGLGPPTGPELLGFSPSAAMASGPQWQGRHCDFAAAGGAVWLSGHSASSAPQ